MIYFDFILQQVGQNILQGMEYNKTLIAFDMRMCCISQETEQKIKTYIHDNRHYIRMSFTERGIVKLQKVVKFKEFKEFQEDETKINLSTRDILSEMNEVFSAFV